MELSATHHSEAVRNKFTELTASCRYLATEEDVREVEKAFRMTTGRYMPAGAEIGPEEEKEILRLLEIALILTREIGLGKTSIICALLHRPVKEGLLSLEEVGKQFNEKIVRISEGLKNINHIYATQKIVDSENFRKLLLSFSRDVRVQLIFLAEKLYALRTAEELPEEQRRQLAKETDYIYLPFAHRLGLYNIKSEMEDRSLRYAKPQVYADISRKLAESKDAREKYIAEFIAPVVQEMEKRGMRFKVKYRTKTIASILNKMRKSQVEFEEIYDIFAVRFIMDSTGENEKPDCWRAYSIVTDKYTPNPQRLRDWISVPKTNGYESLQITVLGPGKRWVEVQIRTERMDDIAEKGFAAHWKYKGGSSDAVIENWLNELREILESPQGNTMELLDDLKLDLQDQEVHVFTPKGDLITLRSGATLLDFAYSIHSGLGGKCVGGKVNGRNETLRYQLRNGDEISILTSANQQPKADWLNIAVTTKARNRIRQFLNEEVNRQADIGKETLVRRLKNWKIEFNDELVRKLMHHYKYKFALDLYQGIADGRHEPAEIKEVLTQPKEEEKMLPQLPLRDVRITQPRKSEEDVLVIDKNVDNVEYKFARCCNPVYGDDIIGFVSIGEGIKVHRRQCKNALDLQNRYPYRIVKTQWTNEGAASYQTTLSLLGKDDASVVNKITELITKDPRITLRGISLHSAEGMFEGEITILIANTEHLAQLINRLRQLPGVRKVGRRDSMLES